MFGAFQLGDPLWSIIEALLIGLLIGAERELDKDEQQSGARDFILIAVTAAVCALIGSAALTAAALAAILVFLGLLRYRAPGRTGITTEIAAVATFALAYLACTPEVPRGSTIAVGLAIVVSAFLALKRSLHRLLRESITVDEFLATLRFLAIIFVVYPLLPEGAFGPYEFFEPRKIWMLVILVSSISYAGYFLEKFLGQQKGLQLTAIFGGLASTTAATLAFSRGLGPGNENLRSHWWATIVANSIQFPRILGLVYLLNPALAASLVVPCLAMMAAGLVLGALIARGGSGTGGHAGLGLKNPFSLRPVLSFGLVFTAILFATKAVAAYAGAAGVLVTSGVAGLVDTDSVSLSLAGLAGDGRFPTSSAAFGVLIALATNALAKSALAVFAGNLPFGLRVTASFAAIFATGALTLAVA